VGVVFYPIPVTFYSIGLPAGQNWSVDVDNYTNTSATPEDYFWEANGTWHWSVAPVSGMVPSVTNGTLQVNGAPVEVTIVWTSAPGHYLVSFVEGGLPAGSGWAVNVSGLIHTSTDALIQVLLVNGTFNWTASSSLSWIATPTAGQVVISGESPPAIAVEFSIAPEVWPITFEATGPSIPAWELFVNGESYPETTDVGVVYLAPGVYSWGVVVPAGFYASPSAGNLTVGKGAATVSFAISTGTAAISIPGSSTASENGWWVAGALGVGFVGALVALAIARRRRPLRPEPSSSAAPERSPGSDPPSPPNS